MAGEVTDSTVILQSRLTQVNQFINGNLPGSPGIARFEIAIEEDFKNVRPTDWIEATSNDDYIIKTKVADLDPGTRYFYRLHYGPSKQNTTLGRTCSFKTLDGPERNSPISFVVVTGMNYAFFHYGTDGRGRRMYTGPDKHLGYPALSTIVEMHPDIFVGTGDNVYYDHPMATRARTQAELRRNGMSSLSRRDLLKYFPKCPRIG